MCGFVHFKNAPNNRILQGFEIMKYLKETPKGIRLNWSKIKTDNLYEFDFKFNQDGYAYFEGKEIQYTKFFVPRKIRGGGIEYKDNDPKYFTKEDNESYELWRFNDLHKMALKSGRLKFISELLTNFKYLNPDVTLTELYYLGKILNAKCLNPLPCQIVRDRASEIYRGEPEKVNNKEIGGRVDPELTGKAKKVASGKLSQRISGTTERNLTNILNKLENWNLAIWGRVSYRSIAKATGLQKTVVARMKHPNFGCHGKSKRTRTVQVRS